MRRLELHRRFADRRIRGQAMVEYSSISFFLILTLVGFLWVPIPGLSSGNMVDAMLNAFQTYYDSFFYVLNLPFP